MVEAVSWSGDAIFVLSYLHSLGHDLDRWLTHSQVVWMELVSLLDFLVANGEFSHNSSWRPGGGTPFAMQWIRVGRSCGIQGQGE